MCKENRVGCERSKTEIGIPFEGDTFFWEFHWDIDSHNVIVLRIYIFFIQQREWWQQQGGGKRKRECKTEDNTTTVWCVEGRWHSFSRYCYFGFVVIKTITDFNRPKWHKNTSQPSDKRVQSTVFISCHHFSNCTFSPNSNTYFAYASDDGQKWNGPLCDAKSEI